VKLLFTNCKYITCNSIAVIVIATTAENALVATDIIRQDIAGNGCLPNPSESTRIKNFMSWAALLLTQLVVCDVRVFLFATVSSLLIRPHPPTRQKLRFRHSSAYRSCLRSDIMCTCTAIFFYSNTFISNQI
jgi:hypothetical protein